MCTAKARFNPRNLTIWSAVMFSTKGGTLSFHVMSIAQIMFRLKLTILFSSTTFILIGKILSFCKMITSSMIPLLYFFAKRQQLCLNDVTENTKKKHTHTHKKLIDRNCVKIRSGAFYILLIDD